MSDYFADALAEIVANDPSLSRAELDKAEKQLRADNEFQRAFCTEVRQRTGATFVWDVAQQGLALKGIALK